MSLWGKVGVIIQDLDIFKAACEKNQVRYDEYEEKQMKFQGLPIHATLRDMIGSGHGYLCKSDNGYRMAMDTDAHYNSLISRLGPNAGLLGRDYTEMALTKRITATGAMIRPLETKEDGSRLLKMQILR